jgi:hypothetical protein
MKNKLTLSILFALGLASIPAAQATIFVDVATLGDDLIENISGTATAVKVTVLRSDFRMTRDKVYILSQNTIVKAGVTLTIEPGTLIRCEPITSAATTTSPANPGALIIARGGTLIANGTADAPIIFTSMDDIHVPGGLETIPLYENKGVATKENKFRTGTYVLRGITSAGTTDDKAIGEYEVTGGTITPVNSYTKTGTGQGIFKHAGLWGGIVFAGRANITGPYYDSSENARLLNAAYTGAETDANGVPVVGTDDSNNEGMYGIEGMNAFRTSGYSYGGGDTDSDDQGVVRFISNRFGGYEIEPNKELNAFSMYGVGYNTVIEFIESFSNKDDDFEFWGGCNTVKYAFCAYSGDDTFDTDAGWVGVCQFLITIANPLDGPDGTAVTTRNLADCGDSLTENDGPEAVGSVPRSIYTLANATLIGRGYGSAAKTASAGTPFEHKGPNFKAGGAAKWYNNLIVDAPYGGIMINGTEANNWWGNTTVAAANITSGGRDGSGKKITGVADTETPTDYPGIMRGCAWFRCGLFNSTKYADLPALETAKSANSATYHIVNRAQLAPTADNTTSQRGVTTSGLTNTKNAIDQIFGTATFSTSASTAISLDGALPGVEDDIATGNIVNIDPGFGNLSHKTRIDLANPINLTPGNDSIKDGGVDLPTSSVAPQLGDLTDCKFIGAVRDNAWYMGWTYASQIGAVTGTAENPTISSLTVVSSQFKLDLTGTKAGVKYSIERSTDNKKYESIAILPATGTTATFTDLEIAVSTTTPAYFYRVIGL